MELSKLRDEGRRGQSLNVAPLRAPSRGDPPPSHAAKTVDLADRAPDAIGWTHRTSSHYPIKCSTTSWYQFDYQALLGDEFTRLIDIHDPNDDTRLLPLAELVETGRVHEVWIHSLGHSFESMAKTESVAYLAQRGNFRHFGNFDLADRHGVGFGSWYDQCSTADCLTYDGTNAVHHQSPDRSGRFDSIDQGCGNVHFAPNSRGGYDDDNAQPVLSTCEHFGMGDAADGSDLATPYTRDNKARYDAALPDCGGGWQVYWRQSFPGLDNAARDTSGAPMKNWWPFLFY